MKLPKLPYAMRKSQRQTVAFCGINYSSNFSEGHLSDSKNLSCRAFPYLTTRRARVREGDLENVTLLTVFNGKLVALQGADLLYDGKIVGSLSPGEKKFAAINTKLCIFPDKKYLDLEDMSIHSLGAKLLSAGATITSNSITLTNELVDSVSGFGGNFKDNKFTVRPEGEIPWNEPYDSDKRIAFEGYHAVFTMHMGNKDFYIEDGGYKLRLCDGGIPIPEKFFFDYTDTDQSITIFRNYSGSSYVEAKKITATEIYLSKTEEDLKTKSKIRFNGYALMGFDFTKHLEIGDVVHVYWRGYYDITNLDVTILDVSSSQFECNKNVSLSGNPDITRKGWADLTTLFSVGDIVSFSTEKNNVTATVTDVTATELTIDGVFAEENISALNEVSAYVSSPVALMSLDEPESFVPKLFAPGDGIEISGSSTEDFNISFVIDKIEGSTLYAQNDIFAVTTPVTDNSVITIERKIPDLDFICENDNRLFGCSNADKTIYASVLGDPKNFFVYRGLSTDSYAVAVGGEGDFTACCAYDTGVLFWKENRLHKLLGSVPSQYSLYSYEIEGVEKGSHKSLVVLNEILYYKGLSGVYAYRGGIPDLISSEFGERSFREAIAGTDGEQYYLSVKEGEESYLFTYDTRKGIWLLEDNTRALDFARIGKKLYFTDGKIYIANNDDEERGIEWLAQLTPFYESIEGEKVYSRFSLRCEIPEGSYMIIDVRCDGGLWESAGKIVGKSGGIIPISIPINRCDKFELRFRGKGTFKILSILREYYISK